MRIVREGIWMSLGQLISIASMLIVIKLTTTCMDMNDYGRYGLLITLGSMSSLITHIGINSGIPRIYSLSCSESKNNEGLKASGKVLLDSFKLLLGLLLVLVMLTGFGISIDTHYYFVIVFSWITTTNLIINDVHNIVRKRALVVASLLFDAIFKSSILYVVFHYYSASVDAVFMALASSAFLTISFNVFLLYRFHDLKFKSLISDKHVQHYRKKIYRYSWPLGVIGFVAWFQIYCDRWIIDYFLGASVVAKFNVMYQIGFTPASLAIGLMSGIFSPLIYQSKDQKDLVNSRNIFPKLIVAAFAMVICLSLITFFLSEDLIILLSSSAYLGVSKYVPIMTLGGGLFGISQLLVVKYMSDYKTLKLLWVKVTIAVIAIVLNYILIREFHLVGAIYANIVLGILALAFLGYNLIREGK